MVAPFIVLLAAIAIMPFVHHRWWEKSYHVVAVALGGITAVYYLLALHAGGRLLHLAHEYVTFIALIGSLFVAAGGIHIRTKGESTPLINCVWLLGGALLANLLGTTGASMLLIRPWLRMNHYRLTAYHVVFFIFIVSNVGGCLTPIGDPPLFLGFLKGVPFWWVAQRCLLPWAVAVGSLLGIFYLLDRRNFARAPEPVRREHTAHEAWAILGLHNVVFLAVIVGAVFIEHPVGLRESLMVAAALGSYFSTPKAVHEANAFNFGPIKEVAWLFVGIFATMAPALDTLELHAPSLGLDSPLKFYALTGLLSGLLDNAPTYLTFLAAGLGNYGLSIDQTADVAKYVAEHEGPLRAISLGAVFFGALTYIGNGPNFMVKAIAENAGMKMPSFFAYVFRYALPYLAPVLGLVGLVWFWG
jgi:Na+/H+ antiporter NhaD/arsenite permease-like protein